MRILASMSRRWRVVSTVVVVLGLVAGGFIIFGRSPAAPPKSTPDGIRVASNVIVELPTTYDVSTGPATSEALDALRRTKLVTLVSPRAYRSSRPVPSGTRVLFETKKHLDSRVPVLEAYFDPASRMWVPEPTTYNPATGIAIATLAHFSIHGLFTWPWDYLKAAVEGALNNLLSGFVLSAHDPTCGNPNGVQLRYSGGRSSVAPCLEAQMVTAPAPGVPGTANITLRLTNKRNYPIDVYDPGFASENVNQAASVAAQIGGFLNRLAATPAHQNSVLVPGGATATITIPGVHPPFSGLSVTAAFDGEAYLTGILGTAIDELGLMTGEGASDLTKSLLKGKDLESYLYRAATELRVTNLGPDTIKTLTDLGLDGVLAAYDTGPSLVVSVLKVVISIFNEFMQSIVGLYDTVTGQADHLYTFGTYGSTWSPVTISALHSVNWSTVTIPGNWFKGPAKVTLHTSNLPGFGEADNVQTQIPYNGAPEVETIYADASHVVYGTLDGTPMAALEVQVQAGGTADSVRVYGWVVYSGSPGNLSIVGVVTAQSGWPNEWSSNPTQAGNVTLLPSVVFQGTDILSNETYYKANDSTAGPSGRAVTTWVFQGGTLSHTQMQILQ